MSRSGAPRSLQLTGLADVWAALRGGQRGDNEPVGLTLMLVSAAAFALMAAFAKKLLPDTPTQAVVLTRGVMMSAVFLAAARWQGAPIVGRQPGLLLLRGLIGYGALSCYFYSVQRLPLGDAVLLQYSHPLFVAMIAPVFLGEPTRRGHAWILLTALAGVALIVHPSGEVRVDALVGVGGSMLSGLAYILVRQLSRAEHPMTILIWFPLASIPLSLLATLAAGEAALPRNGSEVAGHLLVTLTALVGQVALTFGLARAGAARATAVTLSGPVFGVAFGYALFGTVPTPASLAGMLLVLASLALLASRNWNRARSAARPPRASRDAPPGEMS
jgi:drug/metabolite transporter (DMT)-like permease